MLKVLLVALALIAAPVLGAVAPVQAAAVELCPDHHADPSDFSPSGFKGGAAAKHASAACQLACAVAAVAVSPSPGLAGPRAIGLPLAPSLADLPLPRSSRPPLRPPCA